MPEVSPLPRVTQAPRPRLLLGALLAPLLAACSMIELGYNQAPSLLIGRLDKAFDLDNWQKQQVREKLDAFHDWHRDQELRRYETFFTSAADKAADGVTAEEVVWLVDEMRAARDRITDRLVDDLAEIGMTLKPRQIEHYRRYRGDDLEEDLAERRRPNWPRELTANRLERIEDWIGSLDSALEARALQRLARVPDGFESWGRYRASRDNLLADALVDSQSVDELKRRVRRIMLDPDPDFRREFEADRADYWREYSAAIVDIIGWLPDARRQQIVDKLREYAAIAGSLRT